MKTHLLKLIVLVTCLGWVNASAATRLVTGVVKREVFLNIPGPTVADLTASRKFIDNQPDGVSLLGAFEAPGSSGESYGQRLSGLLVPPTTGSYVFFIASDDQSELWLSPDDKSANKQLVAGVQNFTDSREWNKYPDTQNNASAPVSLQAGQPYYIEALMKEGSLKTGEYYWIGIWLNDKNARVYYSSQTGGRLRWKSCPYGDWPGPIELDPNGSQYLYCLYAEGIFDD